MVVKETTQGFARVEELYQDQSLRAKELKAEGKHVIGYFCMHPVQEIMTALDLVPYRMYGDMKEPITKADSCLPTIVCPFIRSTVDLGLKGKYDFLDGVIFAHICEVGEKAAHVYRTYKDTPCFYFIDVPHSTHAAAITYFKEQLQNYQKYLESFTGKKLTPALLKKQIRLHNEQRALVRALYDLRKPDPPLISGADTLKVIKVVMSLPVEESITLLKQVIGEVKEGKRRVEKKTARLLVWGSVIDSVPLIEMIESSGANVVMDDTCVGSRFFFPDVEITDDPLEGLATRYLLGLKCPRTFRDAVHGETKKDYMADLEARFGYIKDYAKEWNANGIILQSLRYCDIHGYEVPLLRDYFEHVGLPNVYLEWNYTEAALAPQKTRVQGLLEIIGSRS